MHIKDLHVDIELDSAALAAVRGGSGNYLTGKTGSEFMGTLPMEPQHPALPTFGGDWGQLRSDVQGFISNAKPATPSFEPVSNPYIPAKPAEGYVAI